MIIQDAMLYIIIDELMNKGVCFNGYRHYATLLVKPVTLKKYSQPHLATPILVPSEALSNVGVGRLFFNTLQGMGHCCCPLLEWIECVGAIFGRFQDLSESLD